MARTKREAVKHSGSGLRPWTSDQTLIHLDLRLCVPGSVGTEAVDGLMRLFHSEQPPGTPLPTLLFVRHCLRQVVDSKRKLTGRERLVSIVKPLLSIKQLAVRPDKEDWWASLGVVPKELWTRRPSDASTGTFDDDMLAQAYSSLLTVFIEDVCAKHGDKPGVPFEELVTRLNSELGLEGSETEDPEILTRLTGFKQAWESKTAAPSKLAKRLASSLPIEAQLRAIDAWCERAKLILPVSFICALRDPLVDKDKLFYHYFEIEGRLTDEQPAAQQAALPERRHDDRGGGGDKDGKKHKQPGAKPEAAQPGRQRVTRSAQPTAVSDDAAPADNPAVQARATRSAGRAEAPAVAADPVPQARTTRNSARAATAAATGPSKQPASDPEDAGRRGRPRRQSAPAQPMLESGSGTDGPETSDSAPTTNDFVLSDSPDSEGPPPPPARPPPPAPEPESNTAHRYPLRHQPAPAPPPPSPARPKSAPRAAAPAAPALKFGVAPAQGHRGLQKWRQADDGTLVGGRDTIEELDDTDVEIVYDDNDSDHDQDMAGAGTEAGPSKRLRKNTEAQAGRDGGRNGGRRQQRASDEEADGYALRRCAPRSNRAAAAAAVASDDGGPDEPDADPNTPTAARQTRSAKHRKAAPAAEAAGRGGASAGPSASGGNKRKRAKGRSRFEASDNSDDEDYVGPSDMSSEGVEDMSSSESPSGGGGGVGVPDGGGDEQAMEEEAQHGGRYAAASDSDFADSDISEGQGRGAGGVKKRKPRTKWDHMEEQRLKQLYHRTYHIRHGRPREIKRIDATYEDPLLQSKSKEQIGDKIKALQKKEELPR